MTDVPRSRSRRAAHTSFVVVGITLTLILPAAAEAKRPRRPTPTRGASEAVEIFPMQTAPLAAPHGLRLRGDGYGSSLYPVPGSRDELYGLTDRGPNVFLPDGTVVEPLPAFQPAIGKFRLRNGEATLEGTIPLTDGSGVPYSGRVNAENPREQRVVDLNGVEQAPDPLGYDPEGLVALPDGTFWISDEYGPFITHFDASGRQIGRLSPFDGTLPRELANRIGNRGLEGLSVTPDGATLVAIMQSALRQPDLGTVDPLHVAVLRIVTYGLRTGEVHEYLYLLDNPTINRTAVSEIAALSDHTFLVDERDANFPPDAYKKLWHIDLAGATDVGPNGSVAGAPYDASRGGLLVGGPTLESLVGNQDTAAAAATLRDHGIVPVAKSLALDLGAVLDRFDPRGPIFAHDKIEGLFVDPDGKRIILSNDDDFGIGGVASPTPPFELTDKVNPATGRRDTGEFLIIDVARLSALGVAGTPALNGSGTPSPTGPATPTSTSSAAEGHQGHRIIPAP